MNVTTETMIDDGTVGAAWGMSAGGNPVLAVWQGGRRAKIELSATEAKELGCGAIYCATHIEIAKSQAKGHAASAILSADGRPVGRGH